ncbi:hypothetical protein FI667_g16314, partial [Globisporangium splendens]
MMLWSKSNAKSLPIFFFHGITENASVAANYAANLAAEDHVFTALSFCSDPALQQQLSLVNMGRSPDFQDWVKTNTFLSLYNNINECKLLGIKCTLEKARRRRNFLKLQAFHLFASEGDDVVSPWQTSLLVQYNNVSSLNEIETKFASLQIVNMKQTLEYTLDTCGLRTLDVLSRLHLHMVPKICHLCWVNDSIPVAGGELCKFRPLYDQYVYPVLKDSLCGKSF